jgi:hypothetical protein
VFMSHYRLIRAIKLFTGISPLISVEFFNIFSKELAKAQA